MTKRTKPKIEPATGLFQRVRDGENTDIDQLCMAFLHVCRVLLDGYGAAGPRVAMWAALRVAAGTMVMEDEWCLDLELIDGSRFRLSREGRTH